MNISKREADILAAMPYATPAEARRLTADLDAIRAQRRAAIERDREIDLSDAAVAAHLTPMTPFVRRSSSTAWMDDLVVNTPERDAHNAAKAEATRWFRTVHEAVRADRAEFTAQANGVAEIVCGQYGISAHAAKAAFMAQAMHLAGITGGYKDDDDAYAQGVTGEGMGETWEKADPKGDPEGKNIPQSQKDSWGKGVEDRDRLRSGEAAHTADWEAQKCPHCSKNNTPGKSRCGHCGGVINDPKRKAVRRTAEGPSADSQSGHAESDLDDVTVADDEDTNLGWIEDGPVEDPWRDEGKYGGRRTAGWLDPSDIPSDSPVRPLGDGENPPGKATCGTCGLSWDDDICTGITPAPSGRCPFEYYHTYDDDDEYDPKDYLHHGRTSSRKTATSCSVCGDAIERDPEGEENRSWHHNDGSTHDHEAKPGKESSRRTGGDASWYTEAYREGLAAGDLGDGIQFNPYPIFDSKADEWIRGYRDAQGLQPGDKASSLSRRTSGSAAAQKRPLYDIADEIRADWKNVYFGAVPYLDALGDLDKITDKYGADDAESIVAYFLSNATGWKGEVARRIKQELRGMSRYGSRTADWEAKKCPNCGTKLGPVKYDTTMVGHPDEFSKALHNCPNCGARVEPRRTADQGTGPDDNSQSGFAETGLEQVEVMDNLDTADFGWQTDDPEGADEPAPDGELGPFDAGRRVAVQWEKMDGHDGYDDQQADLAGGFYAEVGPEYEGKWSWTILTLEGDEVDGGVEADEGSAKSKVEGWTNTASIRRRTAGTVTSKDPDLDATPERERRAYWSWVGQMAADSDSAYYAPLMFKSWRASYWDDADDNVKARYRSVDYKGNPSYSWPMAGSLRRQAADLSDIEMWCDRQGLVMKDFPDSLIDRAATTGDTSILETWLESHEPRTVVEMRREENEMMQADKAGRDSYWGSLRRQADEFSGNEDGSMPAGATPMIQPGSEPDDTAMFEPDEIEQPAPDGAAAVDNLGNPWPAAQQDVGGQWIYPSASLHTDDDFLD